MQVTADQTFVSASGDRRGRICRRGDGLFQVVTERLIASTEESGPYWINDFPASGILATRADAERQLRHLLPDAVEHTQYEPCTFHLEVGPYPDPVTQGSG